MFSKRKKLIVIILLVSMLASFMPTQVFADFIAEYWSGIKYGVNPDGKSVTILSLPYNLTSGEVPTGELSLFNEV